VPKTIDNDIDCTDVTFGHDTALKVATDAIDRLHSTAESHQRVMLVEVMGRHAGWIALNAGLASGAHMTLIPNSPSTSTRCADWSSGDSSAATRTSSASSPRAPSGRRLDGAAARRHRRIGHERFTGVAAQLAYEVEKRINKEVRVTVLGHVQRGGTPTAYDRVLATRFGVTPPMPRTLASTDRWCRFAARTSAGYRWPMRCAS